MGKTITCFVLVLIQPVLVVTVRITSKVPGFEKVYEGFWEVEVPPSPKLHDQIVMVPPVEISVNKVGLPLQTLLKVKSAVGLSLMITSWGIELLQPSLFVTVS